MTPTSSLQSTNVNLSLIGFLGGRGAPPDIGKAAGAYKRVSANILRLVQGSSRLPADTRHLSFTL